jgi:hypothetical protein
MKRLLSIGVALGLGALAFSAPGAAAQRPCAVVSVKAIGLNEKAVSYRATRKLHRQINRWAQVNKLTKVRVGAPHTSCTKGAGGLYSCTSSVRVAGYSRTRVLLRRHMYCDIRYARCIEGCDNTVCRDLSGAACGQCYAACIVENQACELVTGLLPGWMVRWL